MQPVSVFSGFLLLLLWTLLFLSGISPALMLVLCVVGVVGYVSFLKRQKTAPCDDRKLSPEFTRTDDALVLEALKALAAETWLTGTIAFENLLRLATDDRWLAVPREETLELYKQTWLSLPRSQEFMPTPSEVTAPREAHVAARKMLEALARDMDAQASLRAWKQEQETKQVEAAAEAARPGPDSARMLVWGFPLLVAGAFISQMKPSFHGFLSLAWLGTATGRKLLNDAPMYFGYLRSAYDGIGSGFLLVLVGVVLAVCTAWAVMSLFAQLQRNATPAPYNNKLIAAMAAAIAAFLVVVPPVDKASATAHMCQAMQTGLPIAAQEGPDAQWAASRLYRSICLPR